MSSKSQRTKAERLYTYWHEFEPEDILIIDVPEPKGKLEDLGEIYKLTYISDKWNQNAIVHYFHHFKKNSPHLLIDKKGNYFLNGNIKVTALGIDDWDYAQEFGKPRIPPETGTKLGILEEIKIIDPETKKLITIDYWDRYYLADPEADWTFISSPMEIKLPNPSDPTLRQEIHNILRANNLPLDSLDPDHPKYKKAIRLLEDAGLRERYIETGQENPVVLPLASFGQAFTTDNLIDAGGLIIIGTLITSVLASLIGKVVDEYWIESKKGNPNPHIAEFDKDVHKKRYDATAKKYNKKVKIKDYWGRDAIGYRVQKNHNQILPSDFRYQVHKDYYDLLPGYDESNRTGYAHMFFGKENRWQRFFEMYGLDYEDKYKQFTPYEMIPDAGSVPAHTNIWGDILYKGKKIGDYRRDDLMGGWGHTINIYEWPVAVLKHAKKWLVDNDKVSEMNAAWRKYHESNPRGIKSNNTATTYESDLQLFGR